MVVNDNARLQEQCGAFEIIASMLAPTKSGPLLIQILMRESLISGS
ncbi:hypothetical protein SAMN05216558_0338 [Pseudomonas vancouverensis]|nr:hypothetical protein SAMN05216558_0338 [Pseudomonas vancouverensis]